MKQNKNLALRVLSFYFILLFHFHFCQLIQSKPKGRTYMVIFATRTILYILYTYKIC
jgi:hypothetical protein